MTSIYDKLNWKVLTGILFFLVIISLVLFFSLVGKPSLDTSQSQLNSYQEAGYSLNHPKEIAVQPVTVSGGGTGLVFKLPQGEDYTMQLEIVPRTEGNNINTISNIFRISQYSEKDITINGQTGKEFVGSTKIGDRTIQEKAAILEKNGQIYKLHLLYYADQRNLEADNLFSQVRDSLKIN